MYTDFRTPFRFLVWKTYFHTFTRCDVINIINLQGEIQDRLEEAQYLREALNRTRESLECEQRLHSAAKTRKVKKDSL